MNADSFLPPFIKLPDGRTLQLLQPLTDLRACHDGTPIESRILFYCRATEPEQLPNQEYVVKVKIQAPGTTDLDALGPSTTTNAEVKALKAFRAHDLRVVPHLVDFCQVKQSSMGPFPGGYITYTIMTKMPGTNLLDYKYWSRPHEERTLLQERFIANLKEIWKLGIVPTDRALRNVLWEPESQAMSIVDFESWEPASGLAMDEAAELQKWGLAQRPPPGTWIDEWRLQYH